MQPGPQSIRAFTGRGVMPDETKRFTCKGKELFHFMGTSCFSQYTVCSQYSLVKVDPKAPQEKTCLLGCGITTGYGAATKTAKVEEGSTVAVFGIGCVGLAVLEGAVHSKAKRIIAVDVNDGKQEWARKFGATDFVNPTKLSDGQTIVDKLVEMTDGGLDYTFDCTGNVKVMRSALEACHKGWGVSTVIGVAAAGQEISTKPFQLVTGRKWQGSAFGGVKGKTDLPGIIEKYLKKEFKIDEYITHHVALDDINKGFEYMKDPESGCIRCGECFCAGMAAWLLLTPAMSRPLLQWLTWPSACIQRRGNKGADDAQGPCAWQHPRPASIACRFVAEGLLRGPSYEVTRRVVCALAAEPSPIPTRSGNVLSGGVL